MISEWPLSVQDVAHSIQNSDPTPNSSLHDERDPLLHADREVPCIKYIWVIFFIVFLCVGLGTGGYLLLIEDRDLPISDNYSLITRAGWGAKEATSKIPKLQVPIRRVVLTSTNTSECSTEIQCSREISKVQTDHLNRLQEPDIAYNFLIAGDGQTYEGRGWNYQAIVSSSNDNQTLIVAFLGVFNNSLPSKKQINQAKNFLEVAERRGKLTTCYSINGGEQKSNQTKGFLANITSYFRQYFDKKHERC